LVPRALRRSRSVALLGARPAQGRRHLALRGGRERSPAHGLVWMEVAEGGRTLHTHRQSEEARRERRPPVREGQRRNISVQPRVPSSVQPLLSCCFQGEFKVWWRPVGDGLIRRHKLLIYLRFILLLLLHTVAEPGSSFQSAIPFKGTLKTRVPDRSIGAADISACQARATFAQVRLRLLRLTQSGHSVSLNANTLPSQRIRSVLNPARKWSGPATLIAWQPCPPEPLAAP